LLGTSTSYNDLDPLKYQLVAGLWMAIPKSEKTVKHKMQQPTKSQLLNTQKLR